MIQKDDEIDQMFLDVKALLIGLVEKGDSGETCLDLLMVAKYLERIGDPRGEYRRVGGVFPHGTAQLHLALKRHEKAGCTAYWRF